MDYREVLNNMVKDIQEDIKSAMAVKGLKTLDFIYHLSEDDEDENGNQVEHPNHSMYIYEMPSYCEYSGDGEGSLMYVIGVEIKTDDSVWFKIFDDYNFSEMNHPVRIYDVECLVDSYNVFLKNLKN